MYLAGGGVHRQRWVGQEIVRAMHATLRGRFLVLLYGHDDSRKKERHELGKVK
jgi:hypothetical protein